MCEEKSTNDFASCDFDAFLKSLCRFGSRYQIIENYHFLSLEIVLVDMHVIVSEVRNDVFMGIVFLGFLAVHMHMVESIFSISFLYPARITQNLPRLSSMAFTNVSIASFP